jgi:hypothetical protein
MIQQDAIAGRDRYARDYCKGTYFDRGHPCFVILTLWVQKEWNEREAKLERGFVIFWNWVSKCRRYVKVRFRKSDTLFA